MEEVYLEDSNISPNSPLYLGHLDIAKQGSALPHIPLLSPTVGPLCWVPPNPRAVQSLAGGRRGSRWYVLAQRDILSQLRLTILSGGQSRCTIASHEP